MGGQWGGAVLLATENATEKKKGLAGAWVQQGSPAGSILATVMFMIVGSLPNQDFLTWGWRIPFLLSAALVIVGLVIRMKFEESQDFIETRKSHAVVKTPLFEVFRIAPGIVFLGIAASIMGISLAYFTNTFLLAWITGTLGINRQAMLNVLLGMAILQFAWQPIAAVVAEKIGTTKVMLWGLALCVVMAVPFFLAINSANPVTIAITLYITTIGGTAYYALLAHFLAGAFPANVRYTGVSLSYQLCATLIGGSTPLIAQWIPRSVWTRQDQASRWTNVLYLQQRPQQPSRSNFPDVFHGRPKYKDVTYCSVDEDLYRGVNISVVDSGPSHTGSTAFRSAFDASPAVEGSHRLVQSNSLPAKF
nr:MFS transporter [Arthrobacter ulcerisalmonis]